MEPEPNAVWPEADERETKWKAAIPTQKGVVIVLCGTDLLETLLPWSHRDTNDDSKPKGD